ncbi:MAG: dTDP-4-dehydrorhamnose reductase [Cyclonatronaceae bacterium]
MNNAKVMLLGADGQLGSDWRSFLRQKRMDTDVYTSADLDITDSRKLADAIGETHPGLIINCAAFTGVDAAEDEPETAQRVNYDAAGHLAALAAGAGAMLVHYSTDYVFSGSEADMVRYPSGFDEGHTPNPANVYAHTKYAGERAIRSSACDHLIIRTSWLCGTGGHNFVRTMLRLGAEREEISVVNDQFGSPSYTGNVIHNTMALLQAGEKGLWHVTSRGIITWYDFAVEIMRQTGLGARIVPVPTSGYPTRAYRPFYTKLSTRSLEDVAGARLVSWSEGLRELLSRMPEDVVNNATAKTGEESGVSAGETRHQGTSKKGSK